MAAEYSELEKLRDQLQALSGEKTQEFMESCAKELAARLLTKVVKRTPVGQRPDEFNGQDGKKKRRETTKVKGADGKTKSLLTADAARYQQYWAGYVGGTLRRGWTNGEKVSNLTEYAKQLPVNVMSNEYKISIVNNVEYAMYVEYGHRQTPGKYVPALGKRLKSAWVPGQFMMTKSLYEVQAIADSVVQRKLNQFIKETLNAE